MNLFINYAFLIVNLGFLFAYIVNLILNLIHALKAKKRLIANPRIITAQVKDFKEDKKRTYLIMEYLSPANDIVFTNTFQFGPGEINSTDYPLGARINLRYLDVPKGAKVRAFPIAVGERKVALEAGPIFTNALLVFLGAFNTGNVIYRMLVNDAGNAFVDNSVSIITILGQLYIIIIIALYVLLFSYLVDSLSMMPRASNHNYLKLYGIKGTATVKTFKFGRSKNQRGFREARMEIEYYTTNGDKINAKLNSFLYSETQEEFINIIYDPNRPENVVYLRQ